MKRNAGFYLNTVSLVAAVAGLGAYQSAANRMMAVTVLLTIAAVVIAAVNFVPALNGLRRDESPVLILSVVLSAAALVSSFYSQVNQIGYVISGLDPVSILTAYLIAVGCMAATVILGVISCFCKQ